MNVMNREALQFKLLTTQSETSLNKPSKTKVSKKGVRCIILFIRCHQLVQFLFFISYWILYLRTLGNYSKLVICEVVIYFTYGRGQPNKNLSDQVNRGEGQKTD